ncbi:MAG: 4-oxalomesaconate tautomerase [Pseudomonadota bacterium]
MSQTPIPYLLMRGGTSRGPYMRRSDLPQDPETLADVLIAMIGSGHPLNIDGIGGGAAVTTKVAMLSASDDPEVDVDYFFAQVTVEDRIVDFKPTCGNILVGVGPAALEMGLVGANDGETLVRIRAVNTGARVLARVATPGGIVSYDGDAAIDGVPGTASPIDLQFLETIGGATGALFPTGSRRDNVQGISVSAMDVAMPMVIAKADDFGVTGYESPSELDENTELMARLEAVRIETAQKMGMGDVAKSVIPKLGLLAPARNGGAATVRYFMPWDCHPTVAVTGAQCLAACLLCPGTVGDGIWSRPEQGPATVQLEHPMGALDVAVDFGRDGDDFTLHSAGLFRTARKLAEGTVFVPKAVWPGH